MFPVTLFRKLLTMPQHKWDETLRAVRMNGFLTMAAIVAAAMLTQATLLALAQDSHTSETVSRWLYAGMKVALTAGAIAAAITVLAFEIFGCVRTIREFPLR